MAVSFEGARAAGSAVQPERSVDEDSAASAADAADGEKQRRIAADAQCQVLYVVRDCLFNRWFLYHEISLTL